MSGLPAAAVFPARTVRQPFPDTGLLFQSVQDFLVLIGGGFAGAGLCFVLSQCVPGFR